MHKFYIELAAGLLAVVAGIYATEKAGAINWLWRALASVAERYTSWLCLGLGSVLFGLAFHEWMKVDGRQKWKRMTWSVVLTFVLLISSWFLIAWLNSLRSTDCQSIKTGYKEIYCDKNYRWASVKRLF